MSEKTQGIAGWFAGRLPDGWFEQAPEVTVDRDEVVVVGTLTAPESGGDARRGSGTCCSRTGPTAIRSSLRSPSSARPMRSSTSSSTISRASGAACAVSRPGRSPSPTALTS